MRYPYGGDNRPDGFIVLREPGRLEIDFSGIPLRKLVNLARLKLGMNAKHCEDWYQSAKAAAQALQEYLDSDLGLSISIAPEFKITIECPEGSTIDWDAVYPQVTAFFKREDLVVMKRSPIH